MIYKVPFCGPGGVGKTSLAKRLTGEGFSPWERITVGVTHFVKKVPVENGDLTFIIWDIGGEERFRFLAPLFLRGARMVVYVFDVSRHESFVEIDEWRRVVEGVVGRVPGILVGNKIDGVRVVDSSGAEGYARTHGLEYVETSALTGAGVDNLLEKMVQLAVSMGKNGKN
jgi:small GTP-binding protein